MNKATLFKRRLPAFFFVLFFVFFTFLPAQSWQECIVEDARDTLYTGMPIALSAAMVWAVANRIPTEWKMVDGEVAEFIYATWEEQGFVKARTIILKKIPPESILSRLVVYTQELPGALAIGEQFIEKIQTLLDEKKILESALENSPCTAKRTALIKSLESAEEGLDECRFVCGHERVHKERHHTYKLLGIQFLAPFFVYSLFKYTRKGLAKSAYHNESVEWFLQRSVARSAAELGIGWVHARQAEYDADIYASSDPKILRAGLRLFKRAIAQKAIRRMQRKQTTTEFLVGAVLKYSHPALSERIMYLEKRIQELEEQQVLQSPVRF